MLFYMLLSNRIKDLGLWYLFLFVFFIKPNRETRLPLPALLKGSGVSAGAANAPTLNKQVVEAVCVDCPLLARAEFLSEGVTQPLPAALTSSHTTCQ